MSGVNELLALALDGIAAQMTADSENAFERSRRLREREGTDEAADGDDYEIGYAEGRHSALGKAARDLQNVTAAIRKIGTA